MTQWLASAISIKGISHKTTGEPCQDYSITKRYGQAHLLVLSDGAGCCSSSHLGARAACLGFVRNAKNLLKPFLNNSSLDDFLRNSPEKDWHRVIEGARNFIHSVAKKRELDAHNSMACTLLAAIVGEESALLFQIGDGAWVMESDSRCLGCVTWPENGEYNNETFFLTQEDWIDHLQCKRIQTSAGICALTGFTDGVERLCIDLSARVPIEGFFHTLSNLRRSNTRLEYEELLKEFLQSERVITRTDDDCTLVSLCRENI